jgi:hypothetical protein
MRESVRQMRTHVEKPKTEAGGRDRRTAARLDVRGPGHGAQVPRGGRDASCGPDRPGRRRPRGCVPEATLPGGGCFLSDGATPLPNKRMKLPAGPAERT